MNMTRDTATKMWAFTPGRIKARVRAGAALLDRKTRRSKRGAWPDRVDLTRLDMSVGSREDGGECGCVCQQLFGDYTAGLKRLGIDPFQGAPLGFTTDPDGDESFRDLDRAWSALIAMERTQP